MPKGRASPSLSWEMELQSLFHMKDYLNRFQNHLLFNQGIHIKKSKKITLAASGLSINSKDRCLFTQINEFNKKLKIGHACECDGEFRLVTLHKFQSFSPSKPGGVENWRWHLPPSWPNMRWEGKNNRDASFMAASWLVLVREASLLPDACLDLPQEGLTLGSFCRSGRTVLSCSL